MNNVTLTLSIPKELKKELLLFKEINWSQETREFLKKRITILKTTKKIEKALEQNDYNKTAINELLQKLIKEGKLNLSDDFSDIYTHNMESLKELYKDEDDSEWVKIMKKNTYKKK
ncbi:MAG: hypothetical protein PHX27_03125 [Candidatus ainarchaeum sp.]|nr:hypothetical protein [Candidatus ainarchaeum sp.]